MAFRFLYFSFLIGFTAIQAQDSEGQNKWTGEIRKDCYPSMKELGYSSNRSDDICDCYVDKLEKILAEEKVKNDKLEASGETLPPQEIDAYSLAMSCM